MTPIFNDPGEEREASVLTRMAGLIAKERLGELTRSEGEELAKWLSEKEENRIWKEELANETYASELTKAYESAEANVEPSLEAFHRAHMDKAPVVIIKKEMNRWWWAAAVLVPLFIVGIWMVRNNTQRNAAAPVPSNPLAEIRPAHNAATLTLANGSKVLLDSASSVMAIKSTGVRIDYKAGQVDYNGAKPTNSGIVYNTLTTGKGGLYQVVLSDGTKVWLNAASSLRYPTAFTGKERRVELTGEAYFDVADRKEQPFSVSVDDMTVRVLGTEFDIMAYEEEGKKKATLVRGAVKVEDGKEARQLSVGEQAMVTNGTLSVASQVDIESVIAWKLGFFQFSHMDIKTLMREISRWYDVEVVYQRADLSGEYGGRISRKLNLSELISLLEGNGVGHFKIDGRRLIVLP